MLCCSPHLFSVVTLPQENEVPFNYACTCECVPLTAAIMLMIKTYRLNKTVQIHNAYVSVITCSKCPPSADTQQRRRLHHSSMASSITRYGIADHSSTNRCFSLRTLANLPQTLRHNSNQTQSSSVNF